MPGVPAGAIIIDVRLKMPNMGEYAFLFRAPFIPSKILLHHLKLGKGYPPLQNENVYKCKM